MHAGINTVHFDNILRDSPRAALEHASWRFRSKGEPGRRLTTRTKISKT